MDEKLKYRIGKVFISVTNLVEAKNKINSIVINGKNHYVCVSNVRTVTYANKYEDYCKVMNNALMCLPDGMPLVWMARLWGIKNVVRTTGPDLFVDMITDNQNDLKHFLLGDTEDTLNAIKRKFASGSNTNIVGFYSPPFCELEQYDYEDIAKQINESGADIVWISLRAPKQDFFAVKLLPHLDKKICIGVGAAFRFSLGEIKHPPKFFRKLGLTGVFWRKMSVKRSLQFVVMFLTVSYWGGVIIIKRLLGKNYFD